MRCVLAWQLEEDRLARLMRFALDQALLRAITEYSGLTQESQRVRWFWKVVEKMTQRQRSRLLRFATGFVCVCVCVCVEQSRAVWHRRPSACVD